MRKILLIAILAGLALFALTGCGPKPPVEVQITLTDFGIEASQTDFKVGQTYRFVITNEGALEHEFMIAEPMMEGMTTMEMTEDEHMDIAVFEVEEDELPPGATVEVEFTFEDHHAEDELEFACHVEGHYEQGMHLPITVEK